MSLGRGLAIPVGIGVTSTSGVNIVAMAELRSSQLQKLLLLLSGVNACGFLSLFSRTLPTKLPHLAKIETFLFVKSFLLQLFFFLFLFFVFLFSFSFFLFFGEAPQGGFLQGAGSVLKALLLRNILPIFFNLKQCSGRHKRRWGCRLKSENVG